MNFFAKKFGKGKMFDVSLSSKSEMTKSQYGHVHDANVVRMVLDRDYNEVIKQLNCKSYGSRIDHPD